MGTGGRFLRKLRARVEAEPTGFVWVKDRALAGTGYPASRTQVAWLARNGIKSILTLTEEPLPDEWIEGFGLKVGHIPMKDHQPPALEAMERGAEFIRQQIQEGRAVAVHCLAGEGRTGCVLSAYLIRSEGLDAGQAMAELRSVKPEFVELNQESAIYDFARSGGQSSSGASSGSARPT